MSTLAQRNQKYFEGIKHYFSVNIIQIIIFYLNFNDRNVTNHFRNFILIKSKQILFKYNFFECLKAQLPLQTATATATATAVYGSCMSAVSSG